MHYVEGSKSVKTDILDFATGVNCNNILNSGLTSSNGLVGISNNKLFVLDRRVHDGNATIADSELKTKVSFT